MHRNLQLYFNRICATKEHSRHKKLNRLIEKLLIVFFAISRLNVNSYLKKKSRWKDIDR